MSLAGPVLPIQPSVPQYTPHTPSISVMQSIEDTRQKLDLPGKRDRASSDGDIQVVVESTSRLTSPLATVNHSKSLNAPTGSLNCQIQVERSHSMPRGDRALSPSGGVTKGTPHRAGSSRFMRRAETVDTQHIYREEFGDHTQLNQYKVLDIIGHGSFGIVRKAKSMDDDETYALKIVGKGRLKRKGGLVKPPKVGVKKVVKSPLDNLKREIAILKKLDHPNIVRLFEVLDDPGEDDLVLVMEYVHNGPVISKLPMESPFTEEQSRNYFVDVTLGLEYLHSQHVIHRDIKPMNLLLDNDYRVKIADFGVSEEIERTETNLSRWAGTPAFVAPECIDGAKTSFQGQPVDIWAAGVTLYCFAVGKVPWSPPSIVDLYDQIKTDDPPLPDDLPDDLKDLLIRLLDKNQKKRITITEIREHPWILKSTRQLPTKEENCHVEINVSDEDMEHAFKTYRTPIHILAMIKQMAKRRSLRRPFSPKSSPATSPVTSPLTSPRHSVNKEEEAAATNSHKSQGSVRKRETFARSHNAPPIIVDNVDEP